MYAFEAIQAALSSLAQEKGWALEPYVYDGDKESYVTYNTADDIAGEFGDNLALERTVSLQIHYFTPLYKRGTRKKTNYIPAMESIREALAQNDFTYPRVEVRTDRTNDPQADAWHLIFECDFSEHIERED